MNKTVSLSEARAHFSKICKYVNETGNTVTVIKNSKPYVKIEPIKEEQ